MEKKIIYEEKVVVDTDLEYQKTAKNGGKYECSRIDILNVE